VWDAADGKDWIARTFGLFSTLRASCERQPNAPSDRQTRYDDDGGLHRPEILASQSELGEIARSRDCDKRVCPKAAEL